MVDMMKAVLGWAGPGKEQRNIYSLIFFLIFFFLFFPLYFMTSLDGKLTGHERTDGPTDILISRSEDKKSKSS